MVKIVHMMMEKMVVMVKMVTMLENMMVKIVHMMMEKMVVKRVVKRRWWWW